MQCDLNSRHGRFNLHPVHSAVCLLFFPAIVLGWMINEDYQQRDDRAATDFHIILAGDVRNQITGGGRSPVTNPFANPDVTIATTGIGNTELTFKGSNTIAKNLTANRHFGVYGTGTKPRVRFKAWSYATSPFVVPVPKSNFDFLYSLSASELTITVENISDDVVTFTDVGYRLFPSEQPIENLSRDVMPPSAFQSLSQLNHEYAIGETDSVVIPGVDPTVYAMTYGTVFFSGSSAGNSYNNEGIGTGGEWSQVAVIDQVPEPAALAMILGGTVIVLARRKTNRHALMALVLAPLLLPMPSYAWTRGNHAGRWGRGATVRIRVDTPPGDAAQQLAYQEAVAEAIAEWNTAQAEFGGLTLETSTAANPDIHITWHNDTREATAPGGPPVSIHVGYARQAGAGGLNSRAIARILKHELGHAEGLGHSARSALMRADAYSSNPGRAPSDADLESANPFIDPTADDKAGKKEMYGTAEELSRGQAASNTSFNGSAWMYDYTLDGLIGPNLSDPITELTLELPGGVDPSMFSVTGMPNGWEYFFLDGNVESGGRFEDDEEAMASLLVFATPDPFFGILPGSRGQFQLFSSLSPMDSRAFTNSPSYDSDEFMLAVPVPEVSSMLMMTLCLAAAGWRRARCRDRT